MQLLLAVVVAIAALAATPALAQDIGVMLSTPDGQAHRCEQDSPGASYEANLVAAGFTDRFELLGQVDGKLTDLVFLCKPAEGAQ